MKYLVLVMDRSKMTTKIKSITEKVEERAILPLESRESRDTIES